MARREPLRIQCKPGRHRQLGAEMALFGNAHTIDAGKAQHEYARLLGPNEVVHAAYLLIRDTILLTDLRLILVDKQGMTGKKVEYHSVPYRSISHFAVETAGTFDLDAELKIWISSDPTPIQKTFSKGVDIYEVQAILTQFVTS
jgi:Bacterial PH domain